MPELNEQQPVTPQAAEVSKPLEAAVESAPEVKPEVAPAAKEASKETFADQATAAPIPVQDATVAQVPTVSQLPVTDNDQIEELDEAWVEAAEAIEEKDKDKPFEEEEDAEALNEKYLAQRFGKILSKDEN